MTAACEAPVQAPVRQQPRRPRFRWKHAAGALVAVLVLAAGVIGFERLRRSEAAAAPPAAPARRGEFLVIVRCRGEVRARRSVQVTAPLNVPELRIVWQAPPGSAVKEEDAVIRFDPSSARQQLQEKEAALKQAQAALEQSVAQARITAEQDKRDLASARYQVERARLEASKQEIVSAIQGEESRIDLGMAEQKLRVQDATVALHEASNAARIASLTRARDHAQSEVDLNKDRLARMEIRSPLSGIIIYLPNYSQGWMNAKPFKVGDQVWPGAAVAEIPDLGTLEMEGKVEEIDRGRIAAGNDVRVRVDSLPELSMLAKLAQISPLTQMTWEWPPTSSFRAYAEIRQPDPRLRPGMNGAMDVVVSRLPDAISIPAKALFTRHGKPAVYLVEKKGPRAIEVKILARNPDEVAISGIPAGSRVALTEPEVK